MTSPAFADGFDPVSLDNLLRQTKEDTGGCLMWTGSANSNGQPIFRHNNTYIRVARTVYLAVYGPPSKKHFNVEPTCGNLRCIAPEHLGHVGRSQATRRLIGVPLPPGHSIKSAGYALVHRARGASIWEPQDIAVAIWSAQGVKSCTVCQGPLDRRGKAVCSRACENERDRARRRVQIGKPLPGDDAKVAPPKQSA